MCAAFKLYVKNQKERINFTVDFSYFQFNYVRMSENENEVNFSAHKSVPTSEIRIFPGFIIRKNIETFLFLPGFHVWVHCFFPGHIQWIQCTLYRYSFYSSNSLKHLLFELPYHYRQPFFSCGFFYCTLCAKSMKMRSFNQLNRVCCPVWIIFIHHQK